MQYINKRNDDLNLSELQEKYKKFQHEYDHMATDQEKFLHVNEKEIVRMKS